MWVLSKWMPRLPNLCIEVCVYTPFFNLSNSCNQMIQGGEIYKNALNMFMLYGSLFMRISFIATLFHGQKLAGNMRKLIF